MKIRTITCFYNPSLPGSDLSLNALTKLVEKARIKYENLGYEVQTIRIATNPFPEFVNEFSLDHILSILIPLEKKLKAHGFNYVSFGPALPDQQACYQMIPDLLRETEIAFFSAVIADRNKIFLPAIRKTGEIIAKAAGITPDGFTNLRFTALANVKANGPYFPAAFHQGSKPAFALALESADLAVQAFSKAESLENARYTLINLLEQHASKLNAISEELANKFDVSFAGMDFSLAPFPVDECSLGGSIENIGVEKIGLLGSLASAAFVANLLDQAMWKKAGFNGLMLPLLEDSILAQRSIDGTLTIKDLLLYSAVCGTGLDTVPLPGDASAAQLSAVLADIAALATRLNKPLTARLMPVPGKKAGELTSFDFEFFKNGRILELPARPLVNFLKGDETFELFPRQAQKP